MDVFTWICIYMDLRSQCLWENFCALLSFTGYARANFEHFHFMCFQIRESSTHARADLAVSSCTRGDDRSFSIFAFPSVLVLARIVLIFFLVASSVVWI